ncbi:MAG: gliding motility-associated ABC transporter permease subunit GldF [Bacteroidetes bacterium]|nr:MAG: gliding motility-associated ABC transporter permease subunit GldF [Bacteroidota bacterium]
MFTLFRKEISVFFSSLIGYIVIIVFLLANSLLMWILPGQFNVLDSGYANIDTLFFIAPWVFMFLVPAVTMRLFADEKKTGTIELLLTRPLTEIQIILSKYFAGLVIVLLSILPTLIFFYSVYLLGSPVGNIDVGGTWGSYIGLFFLASIYSAIGIFSSSITENQIISFILALIISFVFFIGFETISTLSVFQNISSIVLALGINAHYISMSRGVIDIRDVVYFLSIIIIFLLFTKIVLQSRKW